MAGRQVVATNAGHQVVVQPSVRVVVVLVEEPSALELPSALCSLQPSVVFEDAVKEPSVVLQDVVDEPLTADLVEEPSTGVYPCKALLRRALSSVPLS